MYINIKPINNNTYYNSDTLSVIKNLQSLGQTPTGRPSIDRQRLQIAEYNKLKSTLSPTNEQKIQNAPVSFDNMMQNTQAGNYTALDKVTQQDETVKVSNAYRNRVGANQIAEMRKFELGIVA